MINRNLTIAFIFILVLLLIIIVANHLCIRNLINKNNVRIENEISLKIKKQFRLDGGTPLIIYPNKKEEDGRFVLTDEQLLTIKNHINFLKDKIDVTVRDLKDELERDLERLNIWVSILIGTLALLGVFVPLAVNVASMKDIDKRLKSANVKSRNASKKAV